MAEYYKYKPRDPQAQINWAEVGSNFSNILKDEAEFRENKKAAIDEATRNFQKELNNVPQGESATIGEWGLNYSADAQKQMLMVEKLLKSGKLKPRDYTVMRQNLVDGTEEAFSLIEDYQAVYKTKMERFKSDDIANSSQLLETWLMEQAEGFGNFNKSQLVINNETSKVSAAFKKLNPDTGVMEISGNPNDLVSVSSLKGQILAEYDEYDMEGTTSEFIENTGAWTSVSKIRGSQMSAGQIITSISPFDKKITKEDREKLGLTDDDAEAINYYLEAEDAYIGGVLSSNGGLNTTSILTENVGRFKKKDGTFANYDFTYDVDEAKADGSLILMTREGGVNRPVFDEKINPNAKNQVETATAAMRNSMRNKASQSKENQNVNDWQRPTAPTASSITRDQNKKDNQSFVGNVAALWYGTQAELDTASNYLESTNDKIQHITRDSGGVIITFNDGTTPKRLPFTRDDGSRVPQDEFIVKNANYFLQQKDTIKDIPTILSSSSLDLTRDFSVESAYTKYVDEQYASQGDDYTRVALKKAEEKGLTSATVFKVDDENASIGYVESLIETLPGLIGYTVTEGGTNPLTDEIILKDNKGKEVKRFNLDANNVFGESFTEEKGAEYMSYLVELSKSKQTSAQLSDYIGNDMSAPTVVDYVPTYYNKNQMTAEEKKEYYRNLKKPKVQ